MKYLVTIALILSMTSAAGVERNYQDWWWNPSLDGMGLNIGQQGDKVFVSWYLYEFSEDPTFLTFSGQLINGVVEGTMYRSYGPKPSGVYNPALVEYEVAGTAKLVFQSPIQATFFYDYDGGTGTLTLQRFTFENVDLSGEWASVGSGTLYGCTNPSLNGTYVLSQTLFVTHTGNTYTSVSYAENGVVCTQQGTITQHGTYFTTNGTGSCNNGIREIVKGEGKIADDGSRTGRGFEQVTFGETCKANTRAAAIRLD